MTSNLFTSTSRTYNSVQPTEPTKIIKRDGRTVSFDKDRIDRAITRCFSGLGRDIDPDYIHELTQQSVNIASGRFELPTVEQVQDIVEVVLQAAGEYEAAKQYILYRAKHADLRKSRPIPVEVRDAFAESDRYFPTQLQKFVFYDKYSRFNYDLGRRETWIETVDRSVDFLKELSFSQLPDYYYRIRGSMLSMRAMTSMRLLAMAGPAARRTNLSIYNCSYQPVDCIESFTEALIISMAGCGVGFSVESKHVEKFPRIARQLSAAPKLVVAEDSSDGWADAFRLGLEAWFSGGDILFDLSHLRPAGAPLKTKGGRASGPAPFASMLDFTRSRILARQGSFLRPIDAHDIMCSIGNASISGGVRRTAMISLFDFNDEEMRQSKSGDFDKSNSQRWNSNNSAVWLDTGMTQLDVIKEMTTIVKGGRGEPGIFNRNAALLTKPVRRASADFGTNPCGETILKNHGLCNLSIAIARKDDTFEDLRDKVELATVIGTIQSLATYFPGLRPIWQKNCEEERLLGVDINGQLDSPVAQDADVQRQLKQVAIETNKEIAARLKINRSAAITVVKPSGNSSQLFDCSSGLHARWAAYYIRNVRVNSKTPMFKVLRATGVPMDPENGQTPEDATIWVAHFPVKAPKGAIIRKSRTAIQQCEYWLQNKINWTEQNPSVTITYHPDEIIDLIKWVWEHKDIICGMTFLPADDAKYNQMPYEEITEEEYNKLVSEFPKIDFSKLYYYEEEDLTTAAQEVACVSGACEIDYVPSQLELIK